MSQNSKSENSEMCFQYWIFPGFKQFLCVSTGAISFTKVSIDNFEFVEKLYSENIVIPLSASECQQSEKILILTHPDIRTQISL